MKTVQDFITKTGRNVYDVMIAPNLRLYKKIFTAYTEFCLDTVPMHVNRTLDRLEAKGQKYSRGPMACKRLPVGIVMRDAAKAGMKPFNNFWAGLAVHAGALLSGALAVKALLLPTASLLSTTSLLATLLPCTLGAVAAYPVAMVAMTIAVPAALALGGALLGVPRALCNIGTGREISREWHAEQERQKQPRPLSIWEIDALPKLQRAFHYQLDKIAEAPAHERVLWLEGLKQKFPEDFARAAVLGPEELGTKLKNKMQVNKKPLHVKKPKRGLAKKIGGVFGRG